MANRVKEDEKNERIIRNLLKLPENRRCINCNSLGPQYVCTNFSTFICTTCSGIHREFTHRVKSVSMAKFTPLEVSALQGGGNASAREIYLKEWDPQNNSLPDGRNVERLRDFIKHVYVDRRFTGERILEKPPRDKMGDSNHSGSRSPSYDSASENRIGDRQSGGGRSPENWKNNDFRRTSGNAEVVNDWRREDRFGNGRGPASADRSPDLPSSPDVRPVREILGENVLPLRVIEPPNVPAAKSTDGSVQTQRNASSSSLASFDSTPLETKVDSLLIDFGSAQESSGLQTQKAAVNETSGQHTASSSNDWANFDAFTGIKSQTAPSNSLESMLSGFPVSTSKSASPVPDTSVTSYAPSVLPPTVPVASSSVGQFTSAQASFITNPSASVIRPQNPVASVAGLYSSNPDSNPQTQVSLEPSHPSVPPVASYNPNSTAGGTFISAPQESNSDPRLSGRKALPEDLFSMNYSYGPSPASGWYPIQRPPYVMLPQYHTPLAPVPVHNYPASARSINPFEVGHESSHSQVSMFPSLASIQAALPNMAAPGLPFAPGNGIPRHQAPVYGTSVPQSPFVVQDHNSSAATRPQAPSNFGYEPSGFPAHSSSGSFSSGGNPFS